jgi:hypothetical protein
MREQLKKATEFDINKEFEKTVDPTGELAHSIRPPDIPDFFETTPAPAHPAASEPEPQLPAIAEASADAEPEQPSLPFDVNGSATAQSPAPEKVPIPRDLEPPKP